MSVKIIGLNAVVRRLDLWQKRLGNRLLLWDRLERDFQTAEKRWFMLGGLGTWRALDPNTAKQKHGRPKLVQSGRLRDSLTTRKAVLRKNTRELWLGTTVPYAKYLQYGTRYMPERKPLMPYRYLSEPFKRSYKDFVRYPRG